MRKFQQQQEKPRNRFRSSVKIVAAVFVAVIVLEVWAVNSLSTYGTKINELKVSQAAIELENQVLENEIARSSSLKGVEGKVQALGFGSIKNPVYIKAENIAAAF